MSIKKKIVSAILAGALCVTTAATLTGCGDTSYAMTINDEKLNAGVYLLYEYQAVGEADTQFNEEYPDADITADGFSYFNYTIDGKAYDQWIIDRTQELCEEYAAINSLFDENGLTLTDDEKTELNDLVKSTWDDENPYLQYYGINFSTMGEYYESKGIGKESYKLVQYANKKQDKLFDHYFAVGGTEGTTQAEIDSYFAENYARATYFKIALEDGNGDKVETSEGLQILEDLGNGYVEELKNGTPFSTVSKEYDAYVAEQEKAAKAAESGDDNTIDLEESDDDTASDTEEKSEADYESMFRITSTSPSAEFVENLFSMAENVPQLYKADDAYYVVVRLDVSERTDWLESNTSTILHALKDDAMTEILNNAGAGYNVVLNDSAISLYNPRDLK